MLQYTNSLEGISRVGDEKKFCRVLVVDDEAAILRFVAAGLELSGYQASVTTSGDEAIRLVKADRADIMLLDIFMSPATGFDVLVELRGFSQIPVIVFTARADVGEFALRAGADAYLGKPFKPKELADKIEEVLACRAAKKITIE